ncbi:hypothetical protein FA15DRAFT_691492 [Coprinopsis marcescibilis]|uniref:Uncharacterized protein n=1 Tax=Coprinopsis marcescibilis TaxID=230819 RepID=A0A5C3L7M6_COPMA|nr:hypothetical protein FA15DRAFT_691492 [Coprinopsis marcescibilis]
MPPRPQPKIHQIQLKTHKLTVALSGVTPNTTISQLKKEALEALKSDISEDLIMSISPSLSSPLTLKSHNDFELCRQDLERGRPTGTYTVLDPGRQIREHGLGAWETLYIQFFNPETRAPLPVTVTLPAIDDDEEQSTEAPSRDASIVDDKGKGKRRAEFSDDELQ